MKSVAQVAVAVLSVGLAFASVPGLPGCRLACMALRRRSNRSVTSWAAD